MPLVGLLKPFRSFSNVVFPDPLSPTIHILDWKFAFTETFSKTNSLLSAFVTVPSSTAAPFSSTGLGSYLNQISSIENRARKQFRRISKRKHFGPSHEEKESLTLLTELQYWHSRQRLRISELECGLCFLLHSFQFWKLFQHFNLTLH